MLAMEESQEFEDLSTTLNDLSSADEESDDDDKEESEDDDSEESPKVEEISAKKRRSLKRKRNIVNRKEKVLDHILFGNKEGLITKLRGGVATDDIGQDVEAEQIKSAW